MKIIHEYFIAPDRPVLSYWDRVSVSRSTFLKIQNVFPNSNVQNRKSIYRQATYLDHILTISYKEP